MVAMSQNKILSRIALVLLAGLGNACVSYEPLVLTPSVTLSAEDVVLDSGGAGTAVDLGMEVGSNESDSLFNVEILPGVRVRSVTANGPAMAAGIQVGDVILRSDGMPIDEPDALLTLAANSTAEGEFRLEVQRNTTVFAATLIARTLDAAVAPRELYRIDPLATRAGYRSERVRVRDQELVAARVTDLFPDSTLPDADIAVGDLILALEGRYLNSAQDLVNRLIREHALGDRVQLTVYDGSAVREHSVQLWDPGRRVSRISLGPLLRYEASLSPPSRRLSVLDLWLFALYSYTQVEGERSHSVLGLFNVTSDYGELVEEQD